MGRHLSIPTHHRFDNIALLTDNFRTARRLRCLHVHGGISRSAYFDIKLKLIDRCAVDSVHIHSIMIRARLAVEMDRT